MPFADLHCHPAMRAVNHKTNSLWEPNPGQNLDKLIEDQIAGKRGALYDQSGFPKLQTGSVRLVFASLYPLEKGFLKNSNILLHGLNVVKFFLTLPLFWLDGFFSPKFIVRDIFLSSFSKFKGKRLVELKTEGYWEGFLEEVEYYKKEHNTSIALGKDTTAEIQKLLSSATLPGNALKPTGSFIVANRSDAPASIPPDHVITILTIEGMGILSQERMTTSDPNDVALRNLDKQEILNRIQYVKNRLPVFFITFCHHFDNGLCGHARSMPVIAQKLKLLDQAERVSAGFNQLGYETLQYLLSIKEQNGQIVDDPAAGRRILIDMKHMSIDGRLAVYDLVERYNTTHPAKKIPLIVSHIGFSSYATEKLVDNILQGKENDRNQIAMHNAQTGELRFNTWSINLGRQEVKRIIDSDGIIGICFEQNNIGVGFFENLKKKDASFHSNLVVHQLLMMAQVSGTADFWKHVSIGSDFDGVINPVDRYSSALFFTKLRKEVGDKLDSLNSAQRSGYFLPQTSAGIAGVMDDFCFNNAFNFVTKYFDTAAMPVFP